jgi:hypothetical protein
LGLPICSEESRWFRVGGSGDLNERWEKDYSPITVEEDRNIKPAQVGQVSAEGRGNKSGTSEAARKINITCQEDQRAEKIGSTECTVSNGVGLPSSL